MWFFCSSVISFSSTRIMAIPPFSCLHVTLMFYERQVVSRISLRSHGDPEIEALQAKTAHRRGFHDLQHRMEIFGLCSNCLRAREAVMTLVMASPGEQVRIVEFRGGKGMERRLTNMGLKRGAEVEVIKSSGPGPLIVASGETRIALGFGMAKKIIVTPTSTQER